MVKNSVACLLPPKRGTPQSSAENATLRQIPSSACNVLARDRRLKKSHIDLRTTHYLFFHFQYCAPHAFSTYNRSRCGSRSFSTQVKTTPAMRLSTTTLSLLILVAVSICGAEVKVYPLPVQLPIPGYTYHGWQAYDSNQTCTTPPLPTPKPTVDFIIQLDYTGQPTDAGIVVPGSFLGISIEMSLAEALIGPNASWVWPQFLNLMSNLKERGGSPVLRLGGNSQEKAVLVDQLEHGHSIQRYTEGPSSFTNTPKVHFTRGIMQAMRATAPARLQIMEATEPILEDYLLTWHLGNEPDLYWRHDYRPESYNQTDYVNEFASIRDQIVDNPNIKNKNILGGPAMCECGTGWSNHQVIKDYGYLDRVGANVNALIIMHYPTDNCPIELPGGKFNYTVGQELVDKTRGLFNDFARHSRPETDPIEQRRLTPTYFANNYADMAETASLVNKPLILLETNTASCNGYLGLSDAFLATLWNLDLAMQLASHGFTHMMMHLGGQQAYYNPFMSPPFNSSAPFMWTVAPPFYAILVASEFIGSNGNTRVGDLKINEANDFMAGYVLYENNQPVRVLLINYLDDPSEGHDYIARIHTSGVQQASVRYLEAPNGLLSKFGVHYANQTFGGYFESDGLLKGKQFTDTIQCEGGVCPVKVKGPSAAVVFLTSDLVFNAEVDSIQTYATTATTKMYNTAAVDPQILFSSNGMNAQQRLAMQNHKASTSNPLKNKKNGAISMRISAHAVGLCAIGIALAVLS
ncbi:hypothetical protein BKA62DRAFT_697527 [Auriculariales sp. MPI-PUGE-AT-0066]|nr:hypothetical protein BKA62DRAFT_697527 [Auriculariales sp. MPI-PUGE-AT-0066]